MRMFTVILAALLIGYAAVGLFTGVLWDRGSVYRRGEQSGRFYLVLCIYLGIGVALLFLDELRAIFGP